jgi:hypothetical protein
MSASTRAKGAALVGWYDLEPRDSELNELYLDLNDLYFDGLLPPVPVAWGTGPEMADGDFSGNTRVIGAPGGRLNMRIELPTNLRDDESICEECRVENIENSLLHQMAHIATDLDALGSRKKSFERGHGPRYVRECNRIAVIAGWDRTHLCNDDPGCACSWPWSVRPDGQTESAGSR